MRKIFILLFFACVFMANSQDKIRITIDGSSMTAILADNTAAKALVDKLRVGPVTISMTNYGGFEKVGSLPWSLPASDTRITTTPGDIMLYTGNSMVIFYGENTWSYTPLGKLETTDPEEIREFLGNGAKQVTISLENSTGISEIVLDRNIKGRVFALDGKEIVNRPLKPGIYVVEGKKVVIK